MSYVDGAVCAVHVDNKRAYIEHAEAAAAMFKEYGALSVMECWGDDVPEGNKTSFNTAVLKEPNETVVISFITWPSKEVRNEAWAKIESDPRMQEMSMPFDGSRLIFGAFETIVSV